MNRQCLLVIADGFPGAGLGHLSRCSAVIAALEARGVAVRALGHGSAEPTWVDGVCWTPSSSEHAAGAAVEAEALLLDTYTLALPAAATPLAMFFDPGSPLSDAERLAGSSRLVIAPALEPDGADGRLAGLAHACLRPGYWGVAAVPIRAEVRRVLVTTGGTDPGGISAQLVAAARAALPGAELRRVRGPGSAPGEPVEGVVELDAPADLRPELAAADLVLCLGGQTALEAACLGVPAVAVAVIENQRANIARLGRAGAVTPATLDEDLPVLLAQLAGDRSRRRLLARSARLAVDGFGALRVAAAVESLLAEAPVDAVV